LKSENINLSRKAIKNSLWMIAEKIISIFGLIFVTSFVAKYVGPSIFGQIALATTFFQIVQVIAQLGSDVIIFKRVSKNETSGIRLINSTVHLRLFVYVIVSVPILCYFYFIEQNEGFLYVLAACLSCLFSSLDVYAIFYDAKLQSKKNTFINMFGLLISLVLRWFIAFFMLNPLTLCIPIVLTSLIPVSIRYFTFKKTHSKLLITIKHKSRYVKYILLCGSNLVVSSLSVAIYPRLAVLMLGYFQSSYQVGLLSVAATLAGCWAFVCNSVITSFLPGIFSEQNDEKALLKTASLNIFILALITPVMVSVYLFGNLFIHLLYGDAFKESYIPLVILSASTCVSMFGTISARFIAKYSGYTFLSKKMLCVTIMSIVLNYFLILKYGVTGAAIATLATELISLTILNYFFRKGIILRLHFSTLILKPFFKK